MAIEIIAEAGVNHNGNLETGKKLIEAAAEAKADYVKFQSFVTEKILRMDAPKAVYQKVTTGSEESQFQMLKKLELTPEMHWALKNHADKCGIAFISTPFDFDSIDLLVSMGIQVMKVPSGEITNIPHLRKIGKLNKKVVLSTGMSSLGDVERAVNTLVDAGTKRTNVIVLHCNTNYPAAFRDVNLKAMNAIGVALDVKVGYSDHTPGIEVAIAAAALGASLIEKHFTLDKSMEGPDQKASLEPGELKVMIQSIRNIETAMGESVKHMMSSEEDIKNVARKSIVAAHDIKEGEMLTEDNLYVKRPGTGIGPEYWDVLLGRSATRSYKKDDFIEW